MHDYLIFLPAVLRNLECTLDRFKTLLDRFLEEIPDQPNGANYTSQAQNINHKPSNSVRDWIKCLRLQRWIPPEGCLIEREKACLYGGEEKGAALQAEKTMTAVPGETV